MVVRLYVTLLVLLLAGSAMTACLVYFGAQRHRPALWLSLCMAGLVCYGMGSLGLQLMDLAGESAHGPSPGISLLLWSAIGAVLVVHALPRFLLSAFGVAPKRAVSILLYSATAFVGALAAARCLSGWMDLSAVPALVDTLLSVVLFSVVGGGLGLTLLFRSRLPSRSLYRTVVAQLSALLLVLPIVILENAGMSILAEFPGLGFLICLATASTATILHARTSFNRPKYVSDGAVSPYFVESFGISARELEVVSRLLDGLGNAAISEQLFISPRTVENHLYRIYQKTGVKNRLQLYNLLRAESL